MIKSEQVKKALQKDFHELYQKRFTADYREQRFIRDIEIGVMKLDNLMKIVEPSIDWNKARLTDEEIKNTLWRQRYAPYLKREKLLIDAQISKIKGMMENVVH